MTIGYITIGYNDEPSAVAFYDAVLGAIGYERGPHPTAAGPSMARATHPAWASASPSDGGRRAGRQRRH